jgi:dTDP-4-dehydrorhamnose reductase
VSFGRAVCRTFGFDERLLVPTKLAEAKLASPRPRRCGLLTNKARGALSHTPLGIEGSLTRFRDAYRAQK